MYRQMNRSGLKSLLYPTSLQHLPLPKNAIIAFLLGGIVAPQSFKKSIVPSPTHVDAVCELLAP